MLVVLSSPIQPTAEMPAEVIKITGARQHNLRNLTLEIPREKLVVITGVSGSGKSSLAFDTLYAEGQRRYVESLSIYARQFLERMERPEVVDMDGICPAIALRQRPPSRTPRSTVATAAELHDFLRLLYARVGQTVCDCGTVVQRETATSVATHLLASFPGGRALVAFPSALPDREALSE